jgi:alpha-galactosidase
LIENVSGGGARIDFGMLAYTDDAWMDDRTSPAALVRHNVEGLTFAFPPAYLLSFLIDSDGEPIAGGDDLAYLTRSRMLGMLGLTYRSEDLQDDTVEAFRQQVAQYKTIRDLLARSSASLLTDQAPVDPSQWDALQELADEGRSAIVFAFKGNAEPGRWIARPRGLIADATYSVTSLDLGPIGSVRGDVLMQDGIEIVHNGGSRAHVLLLAAR